MFDSTKVLSIMQGLAAGQWSTTKPEGGLQLRQGPAPRLLIFSLPSANLPQFVCNHCANAGSALSGNRACSFQKLLVDGQGNIPLSPAECRPLRKTCCRSLSNRHPRAPEPAR